MPTSNGPRVNAWLGATSAKCTRSFALAVQPLSRSRRQITQNVAWSHRPGGWGSYHRQGVVCGRWSTGPPPPIICGRIGRRWRLAGRCRFRSCVPLFTFLSGWPSRPNAPNHPVCGRLPYGRLAPPSRDAPEPSSVFLRRRLRIPIYVYVGASTYSTT